MTYSLHLLPTLLTQVNAVIDDNAAAVTELDQAIGDGDHVINLQRGLRALLQQSDELARLPDWQAAWQQIGMTLMSQVGGASGALFATLFITLSKAGRGQTLNLANFAAIYSQGVAAVKQRGKASAGEKTLLDVLIPVEQELLSAAQLNLSQLELSGRLNEVALVGVESTRMMLATKGRASFLGERSLGHLDAGAKTSQLMLSAILSVLNQASEQRTDG